MADFLFIVIHRKISILRSLSFNTSSLFSNAYKSIVWQEVCNTHALQKDFVTLSAL